MQSLKLYLYFIALEATFYCKYKIQTKMIFFNDKSVIKTSKEAHNFYCKTQEQEEYRREGIEWQEIEYFNNNVICKLVEDRSVGVFSILDEACKSVGKISDKNFLEFMDKKLQSHQHYTSRRVMIFVYFI